VSFGESKIVGEEQRRKGAEKNYSAPVYSVAPLLPCNFMSPELGQAWFRIAILITLVSAILIPFEPRDSAEFVISVASFVVGLVFIAIVVFFIRRSTH